MLDTQPQPSALARAILVLALLLPIASPRILSGDSAFYILPAVTGTELIHPHHLAYNLVLRLFFLLGRGLGLGSLPYVSLRTGMLAISILSLVATNSFFRLLRLSPLVAALATLLISASGLFWQFSTEIEAYIPAYGVLALAAVFCLKACQVPITNGRRNRLMHLALFGAASFTAAVATTLHQAAALAVPALATIILVESSRNRWFKACAMFMVTGLLSLGFYVIGWRLSAPGIGFVTWMTKYAHWANMPWGLRSNFSPGGVYQLVGSWAASWINVTPDQFYRGVPSAYMRPAIALLALFVACFAVLALSGLWGGRSSKRAIWIAVWILPLEIFILWWTPFLKNFQALTLLPQVSALALAVSTVAESIGASSFRRFRKLPGLAFGAFVALVVAANFHYLILPGTRDRLAPEGDLLILKQYARANDLFIIEWPGSMNMRSLLAHPKAKALIEITAASGVDVPDWKTDPGQRRTRVIIHRSSIFPDPVVFDRGGTTYGALWTPVMDRIVSAAGGISNLRGQTIVLQNGLAGIILGVAPDLELPAGEVFGRVAQSSEETGFSYAPQAADLWMRYAPPSAVRSIPSVPLPPSRLAFVTTDNRPLWSAGIDTDRLNVTSESLSGHSRGADPIVWTSFVPPRDFSQYTQLRVDAVVKPTSAGVVPPPDSCNLMLFFTYEDAPQVSESRAITIPWPVDGLRHSQTVDLSKSRFFGRPRRLIGLRVDPGSLPSSTFAIYAIEFSSPLR